MFLAFSEKQSKIQIEMELHLIEVLELSKWNPWEFQCLALALDAKSKLRLRNMEEGS